MKKILLIAAGLFSLSACSDAQQAKWSALGTPARVTCYSGGKIVFDDMSTGKVLSEEGSDGYYFESRTTHRLIELQGDCIIDHMTAVPAGWQPVLP